MRSITTDQRSPVAISMPGRYKSCRRSPSELFTKEQEQELQRCVTQGEECMKAEQDGGEAKERPSSPVKTIEVNPPKLTPLRWRSTSMKDLNGSHGVASSSQPPSEAPPPAAAEESSIISRSASARPAEQVRPSQATRRPSQAQLRAQVMNSLSSQQVERVNNAQASAEPVKLPTDREQAPGQEGSLNSAKPVELKNTIAKTELFPEKNEGRIVSPEGAEELVKKEATEKVDIATGNGSEGSVKEEATEKADIAAGNGSEGSAKKEVTEKADMATGNGSKGSVEKEATEKADIATGNGSKGSAKKEATEKADMATGNGSEGSVEKEATEKADIATGNGSKGSVKKQATEKADIATGNGTKRAVKKADMPVVPINEDLPEEIEFQPVDLDEKYREKELVRHVTAAKIQNREEALLNNPGSPALNGRKGPVGKEPAAMTIEFLRARLQAERTASKTVKLRMESLSKKVTELESRLLAEVELRKSAEASLHDALTKLKQAAPQGSPTPTTTGPPKVADVEVKDSAKTVQRGDVGSKPESGQSSKTVSGSETPPLATNNPVKEKESGGTAEVPNGDGAVTVDEDVEGGGLWRDRSVSPHPASGSLQGVRVNGGEKESVTKVSQDSSSDSSTERAVTPSKKKEEKRAIIEERLRSMLTKVGEDMAALAKVRGYEEPVTKDAMGWIGQLPSLFQEKQPSSGDSGGAAANGQQADSSEGDSEPTEAIHVNGKKKQSLVSNKAAAMAEKQNSFKRNSSLAKNVAKLVEQYEFQETAQREWEENFEAQHSAEQNEGEPPALVTPDGDVVTESTAGPKAKAGMIRSQSEGEKNHQNVHGEPISRSKSLGFLSSLRGTATTRRGSSNGRIEILSDNPVEESIEGDPEELLFDPETEVAEELPNGIYLHHSRAEVGSSYNTRGSPKDASMYRRSTERVGARDDMPSPQRAAHHSRERFPRTDSHGDVKDHQQGWPAREVQDRASRDMYYDPVINSRGGAPYSNSDREFRHRSKTVPERVPDDVYRNGPWREDRRAPPSHYSHPSSEDAPSMPYAYNHRDQPDQDVPYRAAPSYRQREDGHRGMPAAWQEGGGRGMSHPAYGYPPNTYGVDESQQPPYGQPGLYGDTAGYRGPYVSHGAHNPRSDYYSSGGVSGPGPRPPYVPPERPPATQGYTGWENSSGGIHEDRSAPTVGGAGDDGSPAGGEAGEVLKALRMAKQQIKSSTGEQAAFMTAQYTVSQEHRYSAGGAQVSKTSYTVEAPVGWHLEGRKSPPKRNGVNVTELISGADPLTVTGGESSYVEKLNVGRGIQFFFSG